MPNPPAVDRPTRVWDLPTRLFHWLLATAIVFSIVTAHIGGDVMAWHFRSGYLIFGLLVFRLVWGFVGGRWSRFASFIYAPSTVLRYLRGQAGAEEHLDVGHSPLGSFSVFALLALLVAQVGTGLLSDDDIGNTGPLNRFVSNKTAGVATAWHGDIGQWLLIALVALHIGAIAYYRLRRGKDLLGPMISGDKALPPGTPAAADSGASWLLAAAIGGIAAVLVSWVVSLGG